MEPIFDAPVTAIVMQKVSRRSSLRREAGDRIGDFGRSLAVRNSLDGTLDAADLFQAGPVIVPSKP